MTEPTPRNTEDLIDWLTANTLSWSLQVDPHNLNYETKAEYLNDLDTQLDGIDYDPVILSDDHLFEARAYPSSPVGFVAVWASTAEAALLKLCAAVQA